MTRRQKLWLFIWIFIFFLIFCLWSKLDAYVPQQGTNPQSTQQKSHEAITQKESHFRALKEGKDVTLSGAVANQKIKSDIIEAYSKVFKTVNADDLQIDDTIKASSITDFFADFATTLSHFKSGYCEYHDAQLEIDGLSQEETTPSMLKAQLAQLKDIKINNTLLIEKQTPIENILTHDNSKDLEEVKVAVAKIKTLIPEEEKSTLKIPVLTPKSADKNSSDSKAQAPIVTPHDSSDSNITQAPTATSHDDNNSNTTQVPAVTSHDDNNSNTTQVPTVTALDNNNSNTTQAPGIEATAKSDENNESDTSTKASLEEMQKALDEAIKKRRIQFMFGKAKLAAKSEIILDEIIALLEKYPHMKIEIAGHTDNMGDKNNNLILSQNRSQNIKEYMVTQGIDEKRLRAVGYGETQPLVPNNTRVRRWMNRRVEFKVLGE